MLFRETKRYVYSTRSLLNVGKYGSKDYYDQEERGKIVYKQKRIIMKHFESLYNDESL